jgi:hypothetical protein
LQAFSTGALADGTSADSRDTLIQNRQLLEFANSVEGFTAFRAFSAIDSSRSGRNNCVCNTANSSSWYGLINVDGKHRVVLGLDSAQGQEGLTLSLFDEGAVGLSVRDRQRSIYIGGHPSPVDLTGVADPFFGLLLRGPDGVRFAQNANSTPTR